MSVVHSLWVSKLRYGLQLCTKVIINDEEKRTASLKALQLTQNRMLRAINGSKVRDRVSVKSMLAKFDLLSVNQLAAQIKLTEVWKAKNVENYALSLDPYKRPHPEQDVNPEKLLRPRTNRVYNDSSRYQISKQSFNIDAARLWNTAPIEITSVISLNIAKRQLIFTASLCLSDS